MKTILELNYTEAKQYFLKQESYCNIDLPQYFVFQSLLDKLSIEIGTKNRTEISCGSPKPNSLEDVNYKFLNNKDGKFAWRPLQLIHPALYVFLLHKITTEENWKIITDRFKAFQSNPQIICCSIPLVSEDKEKSDKANAVSNWWNAVEQQSLALALDYEYLLCTDITDCYGSIYTHTIPWALHEKTVVKTDRSEKFLGNSIDMTLQSMAYGQTNGIPQGSVLTDFIAEMVLGYADMLLSDKIENEKIANYKILRYRDDYRVFTNNQEDAEHIAKLLTEVLIELNLRLNTHKTFISNNIIRDAVKPDKLYWNGAKKGEKTIQKSLLLIYALSEKFPNSGSLSTALSKYYDKISSKNAIKTDENIKVLVSIIVDIAFKNPRTYPIAIAILSKLLSQIGDESVVESIIVSIENKFKKIPNVGHLLVWLQRLTLKITPEKIYEENLCKKVIDSEIPIWNLDWLNPKIKTIINGASIIDEDYIEKMDGIISRKEVQLFSADSYPT
ncbi:hypothetical protein AGMMS49525_16110 [Bacteroidia bacterium]|nr:hypothetical protein AGMMS49525_16110 [Bacteroidia bacterium]